MKLNLTQITLIQSALSEHVTLCQARSGRAPLGDDKDFWAAEAVESSQLYILFKGALSVEVESVKLTPAMVAETPEELPPEVAALLEFPLMPEAECSTAHKLLVTRLSSDHVEAEVKKYAIGLNHHLSKLIRRGSATHAPAATPEPDSGTAAASHAAVAAPAPTAAPSADAAPAAMPPKETDQPAIDRAPSSAGTLNPAPCAAALPQDTPAQAPSADKHPPAASAPPVPPAISDPQHPKHSSAHPGDACGDINCDGQRDDRAPLIVLIDACGSVEAARSTVADATPAALRNAARYLQVNMHDLPGAITRRVRARLLKDL